MDENTLSPDNLATLSLFRNGADGRRYDTGGRYANQSSLQHGVENVSQKVEDSGDCTRTLFGQALRGISNSFESAERSRQFSELSKGQNDAERRVADRQRDTDALIAANAKEAALCCCNLGKEIAASESRTLAALCAQGNAQVARELAQAQAEIIYLRSREHHGRG